MADSVNQAELDALIGHLGPSPNDHRYVVRLESCEGALFLRLTGTLLQPIPDEFVARLQDLFRRHPAQRAVVDLSKCTFISSSAIGVLMEYFRASTARGGQVLLILEPPAHVVEQALVAGVRADTRRLPGLVGRDMDAAFSGGFTAFCVADSKAYFCRLAVLATVAHLRPVG